MVRWLARFRDWPAVGLVLLAGFVVLAGCSLMAVRSGWRPAWGLVIVVGFCGGWMLGCLFVESREERETQRFRAEFFRMLERDGA